MSGPAASSGSQTRPKPTAVPARSGALPEGSGGPGGSGELPASLSAPLAEVERTLDDSLLRQNLPANLLAASRYALLGGGKRLRPLLALHSCAAVCGGHAPALHAAAAVEMIHAFSLVHDDLPALDDDDLRRGRPTLHIAECEAMAILAGDGLMSIAFGTLASGGHPPALAGLLCRELAEGTTRMIAGQVLDTLGGFEPNQSPRAHLDSIHRNKTGALIRASCRMGALCGLWRDGKPAQREEAVMRAISAFGEAIGLMFQIVDDLMDVEQSAEHIGKRARKDSDAGKRTFPGIVGIEASRREIRRLHGEALDSLSTLGPSAAALRDLCHYLADRTC